MTFRTRLVLATTVAVVVAVLAASLGSFLVARHTLLEAADSSLDTAAQRFLAGEEIGTTTATLGQVIDTSGTVIAGGGLPVTGLVRLVAGGLAPTYFTTVNVDGNQMREIVEHLPPGTTINGEPLLEGGALQIATLLNVNSQLKKLALLLGAVALVGILLAVALGWLVARTALVPLNSLTDTVEDVAETTDVTRRLSPGRPDELGRLRRTFNRLLEALESSRRAQSQLVLDASHELRTPLTSLRTNLEVIRRVDELSPEDRTVLVDDVLVQLQELTDIVGDLAELARGDRGPVAREPLRLDLLVQDEVAVQNTHGRAKDVRFELTATPCWVVANDDGLRRAVGNLLDNARKWSPSGRTGRGGVPGRDGRRARSRAWHCGGRPATDLRPFLSLARGPRAAGVGPRVGHRRPGREGGGRDHRRRERSRWRRADDPAPSDGGGTRRAGTRPRRRHRSGLTSPILRGFLTTAHVPPRCRAHTRVRAPTGGVESPLRQRVEYPSRSRSRRWGRSAAVPAGTSFADLDVLTLGDVFTLRR